MGYLDNSSITVDAVLTKKGREILKESGGVDGNGLNITSFTLSDTGVDYRLWNPDHPSGSAFYGEAIENLPMLEANVHVETQLKNRLLTLNKRAIAVPALILGSGVMTSAGSNTITFDDTNRNDGIINVSLVGMSKQAATVGRYEYYVVIKDPTIVDTSAEVMDINISGTAGEFLQQEEIPDARQYGFNGDSFKIRPIQQDTKGKQTHIYVVHIHSGAYAELVVTNNVDKNQRQLIGQNVQGA